MNFVCVLMVYQSISVYDYARGEYLKQELFDISLANNEGDGLDIQKQIRCKTRLSNEPDLDIWIEDILEEEVAEKAQVVLTNNLVKNVFNVSDKCFNHTRLFVQGLVRGERWALKSKNKIIVTSHIPKQHLSKHSVVILLALFDFDCLLLKCPFHLFHLNI